MSTRISGTAGQASSGTRPPPRERSRGAFFEKTGNFPTTVATDSNYRTNGFRQQK